MYAVGVVTTTVVCPPATLANTHAQQVLEFVVVHVRLRAHHRFFTSSGIGKKVGWR